MIKVILDDPAAKLPKKATQGSSGYDLRCLNGFVLPPYERMKIDTGVRFEIPEGFEGQVRPRSGLADKKGVTVLNTPGTVDSDYQGRVKVMLINQTDDPVEFSQGERIAQIVFAPIALLKIEQATEFSQNSERGAGGFGSTGCQ